MGGRPPRLAMALPLVALLAACDAARGPVFDWGHSGPTGDPQCGAGVTCGLKGEYFQMPSYEGRAFNVGGLALTRIDPQISFDWGTGTPDTALAGSAFMARWTGFVRLPSVGGATGGQVYRFTVSADDGVRLWVDERLVIDDWADHTLTEDAGDVTLAPGTSVPIKLEYYQHTGVASVALSAAPAGQTPSPIPASALAPPSESYGLLATYFAGASFEAAALARIDQDVAFRWGLVSPDPFVPADRFSARWTGTVEARYAEVYTFATRVAETNEGVRLSVNDTTVIDAWTAPPTVDSRGTIALEAGRRYPITLEYSETIGAATIELLWSSASQPEARVAWNRLRPP